MYLSPFKGRFTITHLLPLGCRPYRVHRFVEEFITTNDEVYEGSSWTGWRNSEILKSEIRFLETCFHNDHYFHLSILVLG